MQFGNGALLVLVASLGGGHVGPAQGEKKLPKLPPQVRPGLPPPKVVAPVRVERPPVFGWADLHAHPASHLGFGEISAGSGKLFAGQPGMAHTANSMAADIGNCKDEHFWDDADIVRSSMRTSVRDAMDGGLPHGMNGFSTFSDWPHARSVLHQQMHISWVFRAYMGGQRLMVASVTDNQTLAMLWNRTNFATRPAVDGNFDFNSAKRQIEFISRWAAANASWMEIVTTPAQARTAIGNNKLALILGLELDKLSTDQALTLIRDFRVRQIIPIHLSDNQYGGTAAYSDLFNTNTHFNTGNFIRVQSDPTLKFRFKWPQYLRYLETTEPTDFTSTLAGILTMGMIGVGAIKPTRISEADYNSLGYRAAAGGHRNSKVLNEAEMKRLFRTGVLIDMAHMSQAAQEGTLRIAAAANYPVMNSHTGLRGSRAENERAMRSTDAATMSSLGGVLGIGTVGDNHVYAAANEESPDGQPYFLRLTGGTREWMRAARPPVDAEATQRYTHVRISVNTADDDKRDSEGAWAILVLRDNTRIEFPLDPELKGFGGGRTFTKTYPIGREILQNQIVRVGLRHHTGSYFKDGLFRTDDNWNISSFRMEFLPDPVLSWTRDAAQYLTTMGGGRIALGTDFNGLEKELPGQPSIQVRYPIDIVSRFAPTMRMASGSVCPPLPQQGMGGKRMHFRTDGLAEYGMLPDFLQAVSQAPGGEAVVRALFRGAEDVILMWEKSVAAKDRIR